MQKITPFLWFESQAEEAANFYVSIFKDAKILNVVRYNEAGAAAAQRPIGSAMTVAFEIEGQKFTALNGGPGYNFSQAVSFAVNCETQDEVDHYWDALSAGGKEIQCGWLTDKFGLPWQIVPTALPRLLSSADAGVAQRVMMAMVKMKKIIIADLEAAAQ